MMNETNETPATEPSRPATMPTTPAGRHVPKRTWVVGALGPTGGPPLGLLDQAGDRIGLEPQPDVAARTATVQAADFTDVRVTGRGLRHLEIAPHGQDGKDHRLHVGFDTVIREPGTP